MVRNNCQHYGELTDIGNTIQMCSWDVPPPNLCSFVARTAMSTSISLSHGLQIMKRMQLLISVALGNPCIMMFTSLILKDGRSSCFWDRLRQPLQFSETDTLLVSPPGSPEASPAKGLHLVAPMQTSLSAGGVRTRSSHLEVWQCFSKGLWKCRVILRPLFCNGTYFAIWGIKIQWWVSWSLPEDAFSWLIVLTIPTL